jgi:hypothetical protein
MSIPWDLYDFALGSGYLAVLLVAAALLAQGDRMKCCAPVLSREMKLLSWSGLALLALIAGSGMLPGETARVWNFLYPVVALPAALLLISLTPRQRLLLLGCQVVMLTIMVHSMTFVSVEY